MCSDFFFKQQQQHVPGMYVWSTLSAEYAMDQPGVVASPARGHLKKWYYVGQTAPAAAAAAESRMLAYRRIVQIISMSS